MATYYFTVPTKETYSFFKVGEWYKGLNGDKGIFAKFSGDIERNSGWWGSEFCKDFFRLVTPSNWELITDKEQIKELELRLNQTK